ncbi:DUF3465 domain-containing protein [Leptolyngbya sp. FACHB-261]|uniref:DUF3465 domain-containing protein n=1 Tax=Leptolyngbya sp. FACHB-261 TaxID=2692806 RepID=UPI001685BC1A|nr:DUF3465 domain-containing protein [Leptolyngbya sp. FACHB-261]MBD2102337.1 DUF3465 domain-containing protein [Leptolyngbya sp. FACHB-261]
MLEILNQAFLIILLKTTGYEQKTATPPGLESRYQPSASLDSLNQLKGRTLKYRLTSLATLQNAFNNRVSNIQVLVLGRVVSLLPDDLNGNRHQRFIVELANSQTLLIAHNIDIAPRISRLRVGDELYIYGEYEWNREGGVIHWTHRDPDRRHVDGWIERNGLIFR